MNHSSGSDPFKAPHPEGAIFDPVGYSRLESYRQNCMIAGAIYALFMAVATLSTFSGESNHEFPTGLIAFNAVAIACLIPFAVHYNGLLKEHEATVSNEKERRADVLASNVLSTESKVTETKALISSQPRVKTVVNNVTLNFSNGASFTGSLAVGENIKVSYEAASDTPDSELRRQLEEAVKLVTGVIDSLPTEEKKTNAAIQLKTFVEEAKKVNPNKWLLEVSSKGLLEAATAVAALVTPVTAAVKAVLGLVTGGG